MVTETVTYRAYDGSLLSTQILGAERTLLLTSLGASQGGAISDDSGVIYVGEEVSLGGRTMTMLGSGTAQAGVSAGVTIGVGAKVPLLVFQDNLSGQLYFVFPDGQPSALGMAALILDADAQAYSLDGGPPICFCEGTRILTNRGEVPVEDLRAGDFAVTHMGELLPVLWIGSTRYESGAPEEHRPVVIRPGVLGPGLPKRPLKLSPQHRVVLGATSGERMMGPAKALLGEAQVHQQKKARPVVYYHVLMPRHAVLIAEGVPVESLFLGQMSIGTLSVAALSELCGVLRCAEEDLPKQPQAKPRCRFLSRREARDYREARLQMFEQAVS